MKERKYYRTTPLGKEELNIFKKSILIEYPAEDLYEDGELSDDKHNLMHRISEVEYKILQLWRQDRIVIAHWEDIK